MLEPCPWPPPPNSVCVFGVCVWCVCLPAWYMPWEVAFVNNERASPFGRYRLVTKDGSVDGYNVSGVGRCDEGVDWCTCVRASSH